MDRQRLIVLLVAILFVILGLFAFFYTARKSKAAPPHDFPAQHVQSDSVDNLICG